MSLIDPTLDGYQSAVKSLRGMRLASVLYYPLAFDEDRTEIEEWDFGDWHQPTMGVELLTEDGVRYSAVWDQSFDYYGLEITQAPMSDYLALDGELSGPATVDVTGHPSWAAFLGTPIVDADAVWSQGDFGHLMPIAVSLSVPTATAWLVAGRPAKWPDEGQFLTGTNDVMVVFTRELAYRAGLTVEP